MARYKPRKARRVIDDESSDDGDNCNNVSDMYDVDGDAHGVVSASSPGDPGDHSTDVTDTIPVDGGASSTLVPRGLLDEVDQSSECGFVFLF